MDRMLYMNVLLVTTFLYYYREILQWDVMEMGRNGDGALWFGALWRWVGRHGKGRKTGYPSFYNN